MAGDIDPPGRATLGVGKGTSAAVVGRAGAMMQRMATSTRGDDPEGGDGAAADTSATSKVIATAADRAAATTWAGWCDAWTQAFCVSAAQCCDGDPDLASCKADMKKACLDPGKFDELLDAFDAGHLKTDAGLSAHCDAAIAAFPKSCDMAAADWALFSCQFAWVDVAKIGETCHGSGHVACAGGDGVCANRQGKSGKACVKALGHGAACADDRASCAWGLFCPPAGAVGSLGDTCVAIGEVCSWHGDVGVACAGGQVCDKGTCVADPGGKSGAACKDNNGCARNHDCVAGACVADICAELL